MAGWVADKSWLLIMVLQIDSENSATGLVILAFHLKLFQDFFYSISAPAIYAPKEEIKKMYT